MPAFALLILVSAAMVLRGRSRPTPLSPPSIHQIQQLAALVTAQVAVSDTHETVLSGHLGQVKAVLVVRGEVLLGPDLSAAKVTGIDPEQRIVRIDLPRPRVISARLDHERTHVAAISHAGLWLMVPGDAGRTAVINRAYAEAERELARAAADPALTEQASRHAERVLSEFFATGGWRTQVDWIGPP